MVQAICQVPVMLISGVIKPQSRALKNGWEFAQLREGVKGLMSRYAASHALFSFILCIAFAASLSLNAGRQWNQTETQRRPVTSFPFHFICPAGWCEVTLWLKNTISVFTECIWAVACAAQWNAHIKGYIQFQLKLDNPASVPFIISTLSKPF